MDPKMLLTDAANFLNLSLVSVHQKLKNKNLDFKKMAHRSFFGHETAKQIFKLSLKPYVVTTQVLKGGTGKTTITNSIAFRASLYGLKVLCIDIDHQANLTRSFNVNTDHKKNILLDVIKDGVPIEDAIIPVVSGVDLIPSSIRNAVLDTMLVVNKEPLDHVYKDHIDSLKEKYDLILIDCPPSIGQSVDASILSSDLTITPINPDEFSIEALKFNFNELKSLGKKYHKDLKIKIIFNKFHGKTNLSYQYLKDLIKHETYGPCMFSTFININQDFTNSISKGTSIFDSVKKSSAKEDIDLVTCELLEIMGLKR
ncbi:hypothetical protein AB834_02915 [PVC group bacterium (ex Bugula neritina AB1)]|nr:hypothetical protein AB834_02915 [PVC group bacterium (ex Bugula neritina AB1)]